MKNSILFLFILAFSVCNYGQKKISTVVANKKEVRIELSKPSVFLSFIGLENDNPIYESDTRERVQLKITNNSIWSIFVESFVYGKENKKSFYHYVEKENNNASDKENPLGYLRGDVGSPASELKPGDSINFSVPKNHLFDGLKIRIDFEYEWERESNDSDYSNPRHSVYFHSYDIPKK